MEWPACLQKLSIGNYFNQPITGAVWPKSLKEISFGHRFHQPIKGVMWPASLRKLSFGDEDHRANFIGPVSKVDFPEEFELLICGGQRVTL